MNFFGSARSDRCGLREVGGWVDLLRGTVGMDPVLVKVFATALALSQVTTQPNAVHANFDPVRDQSEVVHLLQDGCAHIRKVFDIESINLDDLITTAMDDPQAMSANIKALNGVSFDDLLKAYRQFCKNEYVYRSPVNIAEVITYFDKAMADLPDYTKLKDLRDPGVSVMLDSKGKQFTELGESGRRRVWVPLSDIPGYVQNAFVAAEDKHFYQHHGVDERGMIRAFVGNLAKSGRPQGGSTITQQVVKNLVTGDDATYDRKIREIILASRVEQILSKSEILALYLNSIYLGRGSWGIEMAAQAYYGKSSRKLTLAEGAMLAGLTKGPNYFSPDRHPERARERESYVLDRMQEDGMVSASEMQRALGQPLQMVAYDPTRRDTGFYVADQVVHEAKVAASVDALGAKAYAVHTTVRPDLQRATESALQEGLARYEEHTDRAQFQGAETNLADAIEHIEAERKSNNQSAAQPQPHDALPPAWQVALEGARLPLYDVHWDTAVVLGGQDGKGFRVGLRDGRIVPLEITNDSARQILKLYDVVFVADIIEHGKTVRAELRVRPTVQGAAVVLENKTGRILAMAGGFSYPLSQLDRVTQSRRQPGSAFKPITYLAALQAGLQPNTLVRDEPITLPPIDGGSKARKENYWSPKNYDGSGSGAMTLRRALENSRNLVTAHLLEGAISDTPEQSLDHICELAKEAQLYKNCLRYYPFVLGAQPVRMIDLAAFYAAIANEGKRPIPYAIESMEKDGNLIYHHEPQFNSFENTDPAMFYQLKTMLQGVVERGTAKSIHNLAPYVGGKTGTTENENDAWFVGFTNDVTVAVWVGYDNADGQRRTLGSGETGANVSIPVFESIIEAVWANYAPRTPLNPPSEEARRHLVDMPIDVDSGEKLARSKDAFMEHFHRDSDGNVVDTRYRLVSSTETVVRHGRLVRLHLRRRYTAMDARPERSANSVRPESASRQPTRQGRHWFSSNANSTSATERSAPRAPHNCFFCAFGQPSSDSGWR
jgi:penicillin-binding protein 1A